jgi:hypothetical protein
MYATWPPKGSMAWLVGVGAYQRVWSAKPAYSANSVAWMAHGAKPLCTHCSRVAQRNAAQQQCCCLAGACDHGRGCRKWIYHCWRHSPQRLSHSWALQGSSVRRCTVVQAALCNDSLWYSLHGMADNRVSRHGHMLRHAGVCAAARDWFSKLHCTFCEVPISSGACWLVAQYLGSCHTRRSAGRVLLHSLSV